jgi:hypothetical protein
MLINGWPGSDDSMNLYQRIDATVVGNQYRRASRSVGYLTQPSSVHTLHTRAAGLIGLRLFHARPSSREHRGVRPQVRARRGWAARLSLRYDHRAAGNAGGGLGACAAWA